VIAAVEPTRYRRWYWQESPADVAATRARGCHAPSRWLTRVARGRGCYLASRRVQKHGERCAGWPVFHLCKQRRS